MELTEAIRNRRSIRGFRPEPVPQDTLRRVLELGTRAVSANNTQPWSFAVVTGEALERLRTYQMEKLAENAQPDFAGSPLSGPYLDRGRQIGRELFAAMGIERGDRERRGWWSARGFRFFDAPALILVCTDPGLDQGEVRFDLGCVTQNICLAALEFGLGTCVEEQAVTYWRGLSERLGLPASQKPVYGIAIGYPDPAFAANHVRSPRADLGEITTWYGF